MADKFYEPQSIAPILQEGLRARMPYLAQPKGGLQAAAPALGQLGTSAITAATDLDKKRSIMAQQQEYATYLSKLDAGTATDADHIVGRAAGLSLGLNPPDLLGKQLQRSQIAENEATSKLKGAQANALASGQHSAPIDGGAEPIPGSPFYRDPVSGMVLRIKPGHKGNELVPLPGQSIGADGKVHFNSDLSGKPASEGERLTRGFADRALLGQDELIRIMGQGYDPGAVFTTRGEYVPNFVKTDLTQQAEQAMRNFVSAVLRKESGAAIPIPELLNETRKYFPMPGDKPGVIAQKNRARAQAIRALESGAGRATSTYEKPKPDAPAGGGQKIGRFDVAVEG